MDGFAVLPPVGMIGPGDHSLVTIHLTNLVREAQSASDAWVIQAEKNLNIYVYGADPQPPEGNVVSNQIQDACNQITDYQTKDPPVKNLTPVERGEPGQVYYFTTAQPDPLSGQQIPPQIQGPFTPEQAAVMQQPQPTGQIDPMGQPVTMPGLPAANFVTIDDQSTSEFFQKQLDVYWVRGQLDKQSRLAVHYANIFGFLFPIYEWDKDMHRPKLWTDISIRDTYIDPTRATIEEAAYAGIDWWIDAQQAKTMFPDLADIIDERAKTGIPERPSSETKLGFNIDRTFRRNTIILRVFWLRNQPCPYEADEAIAAGLLERRMIPAGGSYNPIPNETEQFPRGAQDAGQPSQGQPVSGNAGAEAAPGETDDGPASSIGVDSGGATVQGGDDPGNGGLAGNSGTVPQPAILPPPQREGIFHPNGQELTPPTKGDSSTIDPLWPMYRCTRQVTAVLGLVVDDRECEYWDIPMLQAICTPIPYQPFGQGLPARLSSMQDGRNRMLRDIIDHTNLNAHPVQVIPASAYAMLPDSYKEEGASRAGMTLVVPDDLLKVNPNVASFINPPPLSTALKDAEQIFHTELAERSGNPEVLNGNPPPGVSGWQAIQLLSQNASSRFGFSMQWTRDFIWRLTKLVIRDLSDTRKVTPQDLAAIDKRYPLGIVEQFQKRAAMMDWDIDVDVATSVGGSRSRQQAQAVEANKMISPVTGDPLLSDESLADSLGYDYQQEMERNDRAREKANQIQQQQMAMQMAMNPQPQKKPVNGSSNGNGRMQFGAAQ